MGNIRTTRYDIGAEVLSILTRGMYPDPKDTLREYIQNSIDAEAKSVSVRIRKSSITIDDDGRGMDLKTLRRAARVGVSDKNPGKDVGFMGIGIYSAFHLCDSLTIYSRQEQNLPCYLMMDFNGMKAVLNEQNEKRQNQLIESEELIDLQSLLEQFIIIDETTDSEFPDIGTRIEINGLVPDVLNEFSDFDCIARYLREVIPLEFDKINFKWAELIEQRISSICRSHNAKFELIKLLLQVNNTKEWLFRSYNDSEFHNDSSFEPDFRELTADKQFYGVIWGCLNSTRNKISNKELRGFLLKKQGFAIGNRQNLQKYFRPSYYDRYIGEVIVVNPKLLPNAPRNDFAYSIHRTILYDLIANQAEFFNLKAHEFQEYGLGDEQLDENTLKLKEINNNFTLYTKDPNKLIDYVVEIRKIKKIIEDRLDRGSIRDNRTKDAQNFINAANDLETTIQATIKSLTEINKKLTRTQKDAPKRVSRRLLKIHPQITDVSYENLLSLIEALDIQLSDEQRMILSIIDERVIQALSENEKNYFEILKELKEEFEKLI